MNPALAAAIKEAYTCAPVTTVIYHTLEIRQVGVQDTVYLVKAPASITATDLNGDQHVYEPSGFQFSLPPSNEEGFQSLNISIDDIDRRVSDFISAAQVSEEPVVVIYQTYVSDDLTAPQMDPALTLYLKDVKAEVMTVTGRATFMDIINKKFPNELYIRDRFPTLG